VQTLVNAGAHNIVIFGTGSSKYFPEPPADVNGLAFSDPQRDDWADTYYRQTEELLAPLAHSGVRIFLFDFAVLQARLTADPGQYGFTSATNCEAGPPTATTPNDVKSRSRLLLRKLGSPHRRRNGAGRQLHGEPDRRADDRGVPGRHRHRAGDEFHRLGLRSPRRLPNL
jgi:hypothetical protein